MVCQIQEMERVYTHMSIKYGLIVPCSEDRYNIYKWLAKLLSNNDLTQSRYSTKDLKDLWVFIYKEIN